MNVCIHIRKVSVPLCVTCGFASHKKVTVRLCFIYEIYVTLAKQECENGDRDKG